MNIVEMSTHPLPTPAAFGSLEVATPELIRSMVDNSPTMLAYFDSQLICRYGNASYRRVFESPGHTLEGMPFEALVQPDKRDIILPRAHAALAGTPQEYEYERTTASGSRIHVEVKYTPDLRDTTVVGMFVELHDITSHKRIEELVLETNRDLEEREQERNTKLFESEQRFRLMVDGLQDYCIYFLDELGHITDWTDSAQRMHNLLPNLALRQHVGLLMDDTHPGQQTPVLAQLIRLAIDNGQSELDGWQTRQGQTAFWAHTTFTALRDHHGRLQGLSVITKDMTAQKRLEEVMSNLNQELEKRVNARSRELMVANRDIDAFSHMVSHDLRAPLRHISGYLTLMREDLEQHLPALADTPVLQHMSAMDQTSKRLSRMIESVLEYARLGRTTLHPVAVHLTTLVHAAVAQAQATAPDRQVEWVLPAIWPVVRGDEALLGKLLGHVLSNALKYTGKRAQARIELGWREADPTDPQPSGFDHPQTMVKLWVKDNGAGFDSDQAQNMYVMFQRQHHTMEFDGTGTGLALSQRIVGLHRGTFRLSSQRDLGCLVNITLPLLSIEDAD
jgi:PAS domain S-box-containing protein